MADLLVDTDVFVDHLRGVRRRRPKQSDRVAYSAVTRAELFSGPEGAEGAVASLLEPFEELAVSRAIAERAGRIRRTAPVGVRDALIAATALEHRLTLVTSAIDRFGEIPGLRTRAPT